jgi:mono/diheme cytochrome c family protein
MVVLEALPPRGDPRARGFECRLDPAARTRDFTRAGEGIFPFWNMPPTSSSPIFRSRVRGLLTALVLALAGAAAAAQGDAEGARRAPYPLDPADCGVGQRVPRLAWRDLDGRPGRLGEAGALGGQLVVLTDTTCPLASKYAPVVARLQQRCRDERVQLVLVNPDPGEARADLDAWRREHGITAPYVHDAAGDLARALGARTSTDVFLLDAAGALVYRGAIDDRHGLGYSREEPRERYLEDALAALREGAAPPVPATWAPGCVLDLTQPEGASELTWHGRISRLVARRCASCHHSGGVAPFALEAREDLERRKGMVRFVVEEGLMPPWGATDEGGPFANDPSLSDDERRDLLAWLAAGLPEGDPAAAPRPRPRPDPGAWEIGEPDLVVQLPREQRIPAEGVLDYVELVVPLLVTRDRWVTAVEVRPTAPEVVHHVLVHVLEPGERIRTTRSRLPGFLAAYVPGNASIVLPPGFAKKLPAGSALFFQVHYTPNGSEALDRTELALVFQEEAPEHEVRTVGIANRRFAIPPGAEHHAVRQHIDLRRDVGVLAVMPHMHLRGDAFRVTTTPPEGEPRTLLEVPRYDFNWQLAYRYADPVLLPAGSRIDVTGWFDNSADNPANPDPEARVRWGDQTDDEMMIGYVEYYYR